ncbi:hypothetical protein E9993_18170 [Labilibacter sediminis]|nr:hypothetical protein E9993_18170 [Labilibacter sediminis]
MKYLTLLITGLLITTFTYAQSFKEEVDLLQAAFGMEKKVIVDQFVHPDEAQQDAFWKVYDEYETKRKDFGKKRLDLLVNYSEIWENMSDAQADSFMKELLKLKSSTDRLLVSYFKKVKKVTSPKVATQFFQIESYILTTVRFQLQESVPFVHQGS